MTEISNFQRGNLWWPRGAIVKFKTKKKKRKKNKCENESKNENKNKNEKQNENKNENKNEFSFCFSFSFWFLLFKIFCIFVNSTWPRDAIDGQLSLDWPRSATVFLLTPRGLEVS